MSGSLQDASTEILDPLEIPLVKTGPKYTEDDMQISSDLGERTWHRQLKISSVASYKITST